jgi:hypothetical protein
VPDLVLDALAMALTRRTAGADIELVHHSASPQADAPATHSAKSWRPWPPGIDRAPSATPTTNQGQRMGCPPVTATRAPET